MGKVPCLRPGMLFLPFVSPLYHRTVPGVTLYFLFPCCAYRNFSLVLCFYPIIVLSLPPLNSSLLGFLSDQVFTDVLAYLSVPETNTSHP